MQRIAGTPTEIAVRLRARCASAVGLPITVGVARTKFLAKVASGVAKPDGLLVVPPDRELAFLHRCRSSACGAWATARREAARARDHDGRAGRAARGGRARRDARARVGTAAARARAQPRSAARARRPPSRLDRLAVRAGGRHARRGEIDAVLVGIVDRVTRRLRKAGRIGRTVVCAALQRLHARDAVAHTPVGRPRRPRRSSRRARLLLTASPWSTTSGLTLVGPGRRETWRTTVPSSSRCRSIPAVMVRSTPQVGRDPRALRIWRESLGPCSSAGSRD
jgi:DNA polymerase-4